MGFNSAFKGLIRRGKIEFFCAVVHFYSVVVEDSGLLGCCTVTLGLCLLAF